MLVAKIKWIHEKIAKKSIPVANVCTIVTTTRSKKEKKVGIFPSKKIQKKFLFKKF